MLKHCSGSSIDIRGRITPENSLFENGRYKNVFVWNNMGNQKMSVSLLYLDREQTVSVEDRKGPTSISLSSKYGRTRCRQYSVSDCLYAPSCRGFESIRVYARCLRSDIEYRTVRITNSTTAHLLIQGLLTKFKLKHVAPKLFYLTMEVTIESLKHTVIKIADDDKLARLLHCNPWSDSRIILRSKAGGFIKVYDTVIMPDSVYKSIRVAYDTTVKEVICIVLGCCNSNLPEKELCLLEATDDLPRLMRLDEKPLVVSKSWGLSCRNMLVIEKAEVGDKLVVAEGGEVGENDINDGPSNYENICNNKLITNEKSSVGSQDSLDSGYWALLK